MARKRKNENRKMAREKVNLKDTYARLMQHETAAKTSSGSRSAAEHLLYAKLLSRGTIAKADVPAHINLSEISAMAEVGAPQAIPCEPLNGETGALNLSSHRYLHTFEIHGTQYLIADVQAVVEDVLRYTENPVEPGAYAVQLDEQINPGLATVFPWLSNAAGPMYEQYEALHLESDFVTSLSALVSGQTYMYFDPDPAEPAATTVAEVLAHGGSQAAPARAYNKCVLAAPWTRGDLYCRTALSEVNTDANIRQHDVAKLVIGAAGLEGSGIKDGTGMGLVLIRGFMELKRPELDSTGSAGSFVVEVSGTVPAGLSGNVNVLDYVETVSQVVNETGASEGVFDWTFADEVKRFKNAIRPLKDTPVHAMVDFVADTAEIAAVGINTVKMNIGENSEFITYQPTPDVTRSKMTFSTAELQKESGPGDQDGASVGITTALVGVLTAAFAFTARIIMSRANNVLPINDFTLNPVLADEDVTAATTDATYTEMISAVAVLDSQQVAEAAQQLADAAAAAYPANFGARVRAKAKRI